MDAVELRKGYKSCEWRWDILATTAGYSIGLENVWRFSYVCYSHGGGKFGQRRLVTISLRADTIFQETN